MSGAVQAMMGGAATLSVSLNTTTAFANGGTPMITTNTVTGTPAGDVAPDTALWTIDPGSDAITAVTPNSLSTAFRGVNMQFAEERLGLASLTITDSLSRTATSAFVQITIRHV